MKNPNVRAIVSFEPGGNAVPLADFMREVGIHGNTHLAMSDLNNVQIADLVSRFLAQKKLD
jgi:hypothetical protein